MVGGGYLTEINVAKVDRDLGVYLSRNESKHVYREMTEEALVMAIKEMTEAREMNDKRLGLAREQQALSLLKKHRASPLLQTPHSCNILIELNRRSAYFRQMDIFKHSWLDQHLLGNSGAVSVGVE